MRGGAKSRSAGSRPDVKQVNLIFPQLKLGATRDLSITNSVGARGRTPTIKTSPLGATIFCRGGAGFEDKIDEIDAIGNINSAIAVRITET